MSGEVPPPNPPGGKKKRRMVLCPSCKEPLTDGFCENEDCTVTDAGELQKANLADRVKVLENDRTFVNGLVKQFTGKTIEEHRAAPPAPGAPAPGAPAPAPAPSVNPMAVLGTMLKSLVTLGADAPPAPPAPPAAPPAA